ncbi:unnamed protein product [Soboliphyme baturini]|uniref:DUF3606 domain-containing protein n=1 Tax=Soboliphyme baturini TaxID=241478 RepID=A0A183ILP3_9BILA|nr:unnamed protein product [Soboliphyme baturini]
MTDCSGWSFDSDDSNGTSGSGQINNDDRMRSRREGEETTGPLGHNTEHCVVQSEEAIEVGRVSADDVVKA